MSKHPDPPLAASSAYIQLHTTALAFIDAQAQAPEHPDRMDFDRISELCTSDYQHSWGHNYATSLNPRFQGTQSFHDFATHLRAMLPNLKSWETTVTDTTVDEPKRKVILRISFWMVPRDTEEPVENDLLWMLEMDEEGKKIKSSKEFVDGVAAAKLKEIIMANSGKK
jgi:hypothetical protein